MYKIIGADGKEYGPVSAEQLRQWVRENRANARTLVQAEGSPDLRALNQCPEFADLFGAPAAPPPPAARPADPDAWAAQIIASGRVIDIGSCISRAWTLWKANLGLLIGASLLMGLLVGGIGMVLSLAVRIPLGMRTWPGILGGMAANMLWSFLTGGAMMGGLFHLNLKLIRGEPARLGDVFAGFRQAFGRLTGTYILSLLLIYLGLAFCLVPGIYLGVAWMFALPLIMDTPLGVWQALELSRKVVTRQWWILFALALLAGLIAAAGIIACCIGILFTAPLMYTILMYAYDDLFGPTPQT